MNIMNLSRKVIAVFEEFKVVFVPYSPVPYQVWDESRENPLHPIQCFYDKERALDFAYDMAYTPYNLNN